MIKKYIDFNESFETELIKHKEEQKSIDLPENNILKIISDSLKKEFKDYIYDKDTKTIKFKNCTIKELRIMSNTLKNNSMLIVSEIENLKFNVKFNDQEALIKINNNEIIIKKLLTFK